MWFNPTAAQHHKVILSFPSPSGMGERTGGKKKKKQCRTRGLKATETEKEKKMKIIIEMVIYANLTTFALCNYSPPADGHTASP